MATTFSPKTSSFERTLASARSTMLFSEVVRLAVDSFRASKVRFMLTMLGMVIGSASIILVVTIGLTGKEYALNLISSIGPNMIEMQYNGGTIAGPDNVSTPDLFTREDLNAVVEQVPGIVASSPMLEVHYNVGMPGGVTKDAMLLGVSPQYKDVRNLAVLAGRFFDDQDAATHTKVAVIVEPFAKALFGSSAAAINQNITVKGIPFVIIGVFKMRVDTFGQSEINDQTLLIPYPVARYFTGKDTVKETLLHHEGPDDRHPCFEADYGHHQEPASGYLDLHRLHHDPGSLRDGIDCQYADAGVDPRRRHHPHRQRRRHHEQYAGQRSGKNQGDRNPQGPRRHQP